MKTQLVPQTSALGVQGHAFDIQAILGSGFMPLRHCTYWLLEIVDPSLAKRWLSSVLDLHLVKSVSDLGKVRNDAETHGKPAHTHKHDEVAMIAFSHAGLLKLAIKATEKFPFPSPFVQGMSSAERAALLGDDVASWKWGDTPAASKSEIHLLVAHYRNDATADSDGPLAKHDWAGRGLNSLQSIETCPSYAEKIRSSGRGDDDQWHAFEPFGFRDGIANPGIDGLRALPREQTASGETLDSLIAPGEFILGHINEYGEKTYCPDVRGWPKRTLADGSTSAFGFNGSYLVARQMRQHVEEFRNLERQFASQTQSHQPTVAELMIGRRKDGSSLIQCPDAPAAVDEFRYRTDDDVGFQCPRGAHVRRANPRDTLGWNSLSGVATSKLHRLLRRGRVYTASPKECEEHEHLDKKEHRALCGAGLFFMALNSNLERQFELVHARWLQGTSFGDLCNQNDPIVGRGAPASFSIQALPVGRSVATLAELTTVLGGGYFFVPSISALRYIASKERAFE